MYRTLALCLVVVLAGCSGVSGPTADSGTPAGTLTAPADAATYEVTITDVVDGDTVDIEFANGSADTVRLLGVDTPEVFSSNDPTEYEGVPDTDEGVQCLRDAGDDATAYMDQYRGATVTIAFDPQADTRGSYGRLLTYIYADGRNVNYRLVVEGHARVYDSPFVEREAFYAAERDAQDARRGLWTCRDPSAPSGDTDGPLAIVEIHADAAGDDNDNPNDEYLVFENTGNETLDISGWTVRDAADHRYVMPAGTVLDPGQRLTLYTGQGADTETERYWGSASAIWNNGGDTVVVESADGTVVIEQSY